MGQSIGWYRFSEDKSSHKWADDIPEDFDSRFIGRWEYYFAIWGVPYERTSQGDDGMIRPTDFVVFREKLTAIGLLTDSEKHEIFGLMTDWLEAHPDVYLDYS